MTRALAVACAALGGCTAADRVGYVDVAIDPPQACAVRTDGRVECWRGDRDRSTVEGITDASGVTVGAGAACVVTRGGRVACWGANQMNQLGDTARPPAAAFPMPHTVELPARAAAVELGYFHACALLVDGRVACWGGNDRKQVGPAPGVIQPPVVVDDLVATRVVASGATSCAVDTGGRAWCWGDNSGGQHVTGDRRPRLTRSRIGSFEDVIDIAADGYGACLLRRGGEIWCWGDRPTAVATSGDAVVPLRRLGQVAGATTVLLRGGRYVIDGSGRVLRAHDDGSTAALPGLDRVRALSIVDEDTGCAVLHTQELRCW